ncbi:hypothetical protein [Alteromonas sp. RKMC-009]|uniref:hypothetical protein n=1 Tax=Alteromonas sp. RKMC-009 TaxID=2267264 RepID=UPI000E6993DE|nr:hypothetical protein [Alteromonas sp. RKMC-009]AYA64289.1 hypothetical protein DS731_09940 [Alteromonas sp. RKMC-009]
MPELLLEKDAIIRHLKSGNTYKVLDVVNTPFDGVTCRYPLTAVYQHVHNGQKYARPCADMIGKFESVDPKIVELEKKVGELTAANHALRIAASDAALKLARTDVANKAVSEGLARAVRESAVA